MTSSNQIQDPQKHHSMNPRSKMGQETHQAGEEVSVPRPSLWPNRSLHSLNKEWRRAWKRWSRGRGNLPPPVCKADSVVCHRRNKQFLEQLGKRHSNKVLDLNNCALSARDIMDLITMIPMLPDLEEINLSWNDFMEGTLEPLILRFKHLQELRVLQLSNCRLTAKDVAFLGEALEEMPHLEILDLSWNPNVGGSFSLLTQKIPKGCILKTLKLTDCNLTAEDGESLAQLLRKIHRLEVLDLSLNKMIGYSLKSIAQELKHATGLKVLNLNMCGLKQDGFQCLDNVLQHLLELKILDLSCNKLLGGGFQNTAAHLAGLSNLEVLDFHQCCITEEDMAVLTQIIPLLSNLQELNLSSNKSVGVSSDHLLSRLRFLPKLKSLLLSNCSLQHNSFASLAIFSSSCVYDEKNLPVCVATCCKQAAFCIAIANTSEQLNHRASKGEGKFCSELSKGYLVKYSLVLSPS
ncbi:Leucine-rich repeat-containing protein 31 [Varanus komodoensis]|nr:Leucine-rich repeat-containing protein 31 [Varanus komodoensis]